MPERRSDPATQVCPVTGAGRRGLLLFQPSAPRGSSPRPPVRLAPNGGSLCVLEAGTWPFLRILTIYSPILSASLRLVKNFYCQFCAPGAYWLWQRGRAGEDTRPYENTGSCPVNAVGAGPRSARRSRIMFGARRRGQAPALQKTDVQKVGENLLRRAAVCQPCDFTRAHLSNGRAGGDTRPYRERRGSRFAVGAADLGGPRAHTVRPYGGNRTGSVSSANLGAEMGPQLLKFLHTQAPSGAGWDRTQALLILRAGTILPDSRDSPRNGGPRGWGTWRMRRSRIRLAPPPGVFWFLFHVEKEPAPQGGTLQNGAPRSSRPTERGDGGEIPPKK